MGIHVPYHITHIDLHRQTNIPVIDGEGKGNYLVFWWKDIALGDLYLEPGFEPEQEVYYQKLVEAIEPAISFYSKGANDVKGAWKQWIADEDIVKFHQWVDVLFETHSVEEFPEVVPVSVVICTRNRAAHLKQCLLMLDKLHCRPQEVIVVDNAPADGSSEQVVRQFSSATYIREPRAGLDIARNTGARHASCPIVAYTDDDVQVHPKWVYHVWRAFHQDPTIVAMTGLVIASELNTEAQLIFEKHWSFNRGYSDRVYDCTYFESTLPIGPPVWEIGAGANMAFRKSVFEEVGYFDELLDVGAAGCNGDSEMWYRILAKGRKIHYNPRAVVYHEHRREIKELKRQIYYYMRGFTTAALLQQKQHQQAGYSRHLFRVLPAHYVALIRRGFPRYRFQYQTLWSEVRGIASGLVYYVKNKGASLKSLSK